MKAKAKRNCLHELHDAQTKPKVFRSSALANRLFGYSFSLSRIAFFFQGKCQVLPANFCEFENSNVLKQARLN